MPSEGNITKYNEIDLELPGRKPCAYFCIISDSDSSLEFLSSLFFSTLFVRLTNYARRHGENGRLPVKVNVCLDEFCNIGKILDFKKLISTVRSRGINCQVIVQSVAQLSDRYEKKEWEELVGNCDVQLFLGCNDNMTAEYISGKCGMVTIGQTNNQMPMTPLFSPVLNSTRPYTQTRSNAQRALMLPDEVLRLPNDQCIVLLRGQKPLLLRKIIPDELPLFRELAPVKITDYVPGWRAREEQEKKRKAQGKVDLHKETLPPESGNRPPSGSVRYGFAGGTPEPETPAALHDKVEMELDAGNGMPDSISGTEAPAEFEDDMPLLLEEISPEEIMGRQGWKHEEGTQ